MWRDKPKRIVNDGSPGPGMRPFAKSCAVFGSLIKTSHKTPFCLSAIRGQKKREQIEFAAILCRFPMNGVTRHVRILAISRGRIRIMAIHVRFLRCSAAKVPKR
jgi:hypothetical protein